MTDSQAVADLVVRTIARTAVDNEKYFSDLDAVVGDGDFGYSLARGFELVLADFDAIDRSSVGAFLKKIGFLVTSRVGGTSGPIWGTAFLRAAAAAGDSGHLSGQDAIAMLRAAVAGIQTRGGAELGDKTLLDAFVPAIDALEKELQSQASAPDAVAAAAAAARAAAELTATMIARRGRAAYSGERSRGSVDAGAIAVALMIENLTVEWTNPKDER